MAEATSERETSFNMGTLLLIREGIHLFACGSGNYRPLQTRRQGPHLDRNRTFRPAQKGINPPFSARGAAGRKGASGGDPEATFVEPGRGAAVLHPRNCLPEARIAASPRPGWRRRGE